MNSLHPAHRLAVVALALALAACGRSEPTSEVVVPHQITRETASSIDGMLLAEHPGPKAQIHYARRDQPEWYCNTADMFNMYLAPEQLRQVAAIFVQDMGKADWEQPVGHWIDARTAWYVAGSSRRGSMGPTLGSFAREEDAHAFAKTYGGSVLRFDEVTLDTVARPHDRLPAIGD